MEMKIEMKMEMEMEMKFYLICLNSILDEL